jgi:hypothetical protein
VACAFAASVDTACIRRHVVIGLLAVGFAVGLLSGCQHQRSSTSPMATTVGGVGTGGISGPGIGSGLVVLGSRTSFGPHGRGWGTAHPRSLDNDGDPSGRAWKIRWPTWGSAVSRGSGLTYYLPEKMGSGYQTGRVQFRASRIGHCSANGPLAYTRLEVRLASLRGDSFSAWQLWNGRPNLCRPSP